MKSTPPTNKKKIVSEKETSSKSPIPGKSKSKQKPGNETEQSLSQHNPASGRECLTMVAIGASAGGLEAVTQLLQNLSPNTGMAFIYLQHLSPDHKSLLTPLLSKTTEMKVQDLVDMEIRPNNVYVIPYNKEIEVVDGRIQLIPRHQDKSSNLSIDVLFSSLAETHKENVIGIVLSGSASDGTRGLREIKEAGGITFAQDNSAKFTSMPHSAIAGGMVDFVLSPKEIAAELNWMSQHPLVKRNAVKTGPEDEIENSNPDLKNILQLLLRKKSVDFSHYKMSTIKRRMLRRMLIHRIETLKQYAGLLVQKENEVDLLYQDLLINVTEFFRDADAFLFLKKPVLSQLLKNKSQNETLRIWVAACSTGEEAYSIAMTLLELQENKTNRIPFQIFASDLSVSAINEARIGEYSLQQIKNISPKRLQQFFTKSKDKYRISKALRDVCVFAQHNILRDPPFSRMDFISCRNLLIYLDHAAQKKTISTLHYALNDSGCLMLGKSETVGASEELFTSVNKKFKIFSRKKNSGAYKITEVTPLISPEALNEKNNITTTIPRKPATYNHGNPGNAFDAVLLTHYVPASVIVNQDLEILHFRGSTEMYLKNSSGKASFNILKMARPEITFELRNAIHHAIKTQQTVRKAGIELNRDAIGNTVQIVNLEVMPLKIEGEEPLLVIVFTGHRQMELMEHTKQGRKNNSNAKDLRIRKLEEELEATRSDMASITHDQEAANEELQSANEEIVSSNEELQSLNEELETSKEEIESTNEELSTSNQELLARNQQVEELYNYNEAILSTVQEPMLIIDKEMRIKSANKSFCKIFHVTEDESIGISLYKLGNNQWNIPRLRELLEDIVPKNIRFNNFEVEHTFPVIGHKIMLLNAHRIIQQSQNEELIVLTIIDITEIRNLATQLQSKERKALEKQLEVEKKVLKLMEESNKRYNLLLMQSSFAFAILKGKDMVITLANDSIKEMWGKGKDLEGKPILQVLPELKDQTFPKLIENVYTTGLPYYGYEILVRLNRDSKMEDAYFNFVYQPYREADETISGVTVISYEVTSHVIAKNELIRAKENAEREKSVAEIAVKAKQQFLSNMSHEIRTPLNAIIGFTKVILRTELTAKQKEYVSAIKASGDSLIVLINDILDLAKVDAGKMIFVQTPFKMEDSISTMLHLFEPKIKENNSELKKEYDNKIPGILLGDSMRLRQIIFNLLNNAVKFTSGGKIKLCVRLLNEDEKKVSIEFSIIDTGIGIPEDQLEAIFENFQQASLNTSKFYGGTGLGLAIVKQMVESQGGSISVKSEIDKGSTFSFILSFQKTNAKVVLEEKRMELDAERKNIKVLVAEDIALNQLLMKTLLDDFGFERDVVDNGKMAIKELQTKSYDIILMDLHMPEMNGFEATEYIRNTMKSKIPIIALTADVTTVDLEKCKTVGMNDYISKPVEETLLYSKIVGLVKMSMPEKPGTGKVFSPLNDEVGQGFTESGELKCTDLTYLKHRTKSDPMLMLEMISLYLEQTPTLVSAMEQSVRDKDWSLLRGAVHKIIPSFSIMGISAEFENMAKKLQGYAANQQNTDEIPDLVLQISKICAQAYKELQEEDKKIKRQLE